MARTLAQMLPILAELSARRDERRSLAELAALAGRSPSHFQRAFTRAVGESPKQFIRRLQLECAAAALLVDDRKVLDVALDCGFESHEGFTRAFTKHFGQSPRAFRNRHASLEFDALRQQAQRIERTSPCVGLFRAPLDDLPSRFKEPTMNYDITTQELPETTFLYKEAKTTHAELAGALGQVLPAVFGHCMGKGVEMQSPPMTIYTHWGPGMVTLRGGMLVPAGTEGEGEVLAEVLPASRAAVTIHTGNYDGLGDAHAALETYVAEQGLEASGPPREVYLTDPGEVPDPADWKTQVILPVK